MKANSARRGRWPARAMVACVAVIPLVITGCSSSKSSGGAVTIHWGTPSTDTQIKTEQTIIDAFEKANPKIKVKVDQIDFNNYDTKLSTSLRGRSGPDVFQVNHPNVQAWTNAGYLTDLNSAISSGQIATKDFIPGLLDIGKVKGGQYTVPLTTDARALWYNPALFKSAGIATPPKTWDELVTDVAKFKGTDKYGFVFRSDNDYAMAYEAAGSFIKSAGGQILSGADSPKGVAGSDDNTVAAVQLLQDIYKTGAVPPGENNMSEQTMTKLFAGGKVAMMVGGPWFKAEIEAANPKAKFGTSYVTTTIPTPQAGGKPASASGGWQVGVSKFTKHADAAKKLLAWMTTKDNLIKQSSTGAFPPINDGMDGATFSSAFYAPFKAELPNSGLPIPPVTQLAQVAAAFEKYVLPAVTGGKNVKDQLNSFDSEVDEQVLQ